MSEVQTQSTCDLPIYYNESKISLLVRDPHWLYAYWEISEWRKNSFIQEFGQERWEKSVPVLKVTNISKNTSTFIRINEFSHDWYINVLDTNCLYVAELGRNVSDHFFIHLACSNYISTPSETVSTNTGSYFINYKDLKNGKLDLESGKIYETFDIKTSSKAIFGFSSPELFGINLYESLFGMSSAELFKVNITEHLGISSESMIK